MTRVWGLAALLLAVPLGSACGPLEYLNQVSGRATAALVQAQREGAERWAPYEYTAANEYLKKAREEASYASYQVSIEYGRRAEELAHRARAIAREKRAGGGGDPRGDEAGAQSRDETGHGSGEDTGGDPLR